MRQVIVYGIASFLSEDINTTYELWKRLGVRFHQPPQQTFFGITLGRQ